MRSTSRPTRNPAPLSASGAAFRRRVTLGGLAALAVVLLSAASFASDETPVADAVMRGDSAEVRALIKQGLDVNAAQADGMTALHWAASRGDAGTARMLLFAGARHSAVTRNGNYTPLHLAARKGRGEAVKVLLEAGADAKATTTSGGATALHFAAGEGDSTTVAALLGANVDVDAREGAWSQTPLMWAAAYDRVAAIRLLLARGADIEAISAIEDVAEVEKAQRAELVKRARRVAALKAADRPPLTPAQADSVRADSAAKAEAAAKVAEAKAKADKARKKDDSKKKSDKKATPADSAPRGRGAAGGLSYGDLVGKKGGLTPLLFAVRDGNVAAVRALLDAKADINHVAADKTSPLLMAAINGRFDLAMELLKAGADPKLASDAGATPLYAAINVQWAAKSLYPQPTAQQQQLTTHLELMEALIKAGADVNARLTKHLWYMSYNFDLLGVNTVDATPFWRAAYGLDVPAMRLLKQYGADHTLPTTKPAGRTRNADDSPDSGGDSGKDPSGLPPIEVGGPGVYPILAASGVGYGEGFAANSHQHAPDAWLPSVKYLVEELGADVNARDHNGYNALHHAAARGDTVLAQYLLDKGADITAISRKGQTVADMANGPVQRVPPFVEALDWFVRKGSKNSNKCLSC
jgi:uncharacterized protein